MTLELELSVSLDGVVEDVRGGSPDARGASLPAALGLAEDGPEACALQIWLASVAGADESTWHAYAGDPPAAVAGLELSYRPVMREGAVAAVDVVVRAATPAAAVAVTELDGADARGSAAFWADARALVAECESALCRLRRDPDARFAARALYRALHTLKGNALAAGQRPLADLAHGAEHHVSAPLERATAASDEAMKALAGALGALRAMLAERDDDVSDAPTAFDRIELLLAHVARATRAGDPAAASGAADRLRAAVDVLGDPAASAAAARVSATARARSDLGPPLATLDERLTVLRERAAELAACAVPMYFVDELERCCESAERAQEELATRGVSALTYTALRRALSDMRANAMAFGVIRALHIVEGAEAAADDLSPAAMRELVDALAAARELARELRPVAAALGVRSTCDALGAFLAEAHVLQATLAADAQVWLSQPRHDAAPQRLAWTAGAYCAAARRYRLVGLQQRIAELPTLIGRVARRAAPLRASIALADQLIDDLGQHLALYQALHGELGGEGPGARRAALAALRDAAAAGDAALLRAADEVGAISVRRDLAGGGPLERDRVARALRDAARFTIEPSPPPEPAATVAAGVAEAGRVLARQLGKAVVFDVIADDVSLDGAMARTLTNALGHAIRNALDHGVEPADERAAAGKDPVARIELHLAHADGRLDARLSDNGRGVNREHVLSRAIARGLIPPERSAGLTDDELIELLFRPGFSTAAAVSHVSGRGVGLDAVRELVADAGGTTHLRSRPGQGCTLELSLPSRAE